LDNIAASQTTVATQQADTSDKIDLLLNKLTAVLTTTPPKYHQANLNSTALQLSPIPTNSHLEDQWGDHLLNTNESWENTAAKMTYNPND
jgi:hypothetical protein